EPTAKADATRNTHTVSGRCVNDDDHLPMAGVSVRLYQVEGKGLPPVEIATTLAVAAGRPAGMGFIHLREGNEVVEIRFAREKSALAGKVIDAEGRPIAGAV